MIGPSLRHVARLQRGSGFPHQQQGNESGDLPFFKVSDFGRAGNELYLHTCRNWVSRQTAISLGAVVVPAGTVLLPKIGAALLGNARRIATQECVFDNNILGVIPGSIDAKYLHYWLTTVDLAQLSNPGPVPSLADSSLLDLIVPHAKPDRQRSIANFLDIETARINKLIATKSKLIESLLERRLALTMAGVSGRLHREHADLSSSPLPWLPKQGADWSTAQLKFIARLGTGHTPSRDRHEWWQNCTIPWITTGEVAQLRDDRAEYINETREKISEEGLANSAAVLHPESTVVLSRTASAGFSAIMGTAMATSQDFVTWTCGPLLEPRFLLLCLRAMRSDLLGRLAQGSTHKTIYMPDIESIRIPVPPVDEQRLIAEDTWRRLRAIDEVVARVNEQLTLIEEHRQALITGAVSGEIEVGAAA
jgi:type I restriction enzyme S subunit